MSTTQAPSKHIIIAGDVTLDWNLAYQVHAPQKDPLRWNPNDRMRACWQPGGAALLTALIQALTASLPAGHHAPIDIHGADFPQGPIAPHDPRFHHSYAIWTPFSGSDGDVWRVNAFLGLDPTTEAFPPSASQAPPSADLIVLDDANMGFRDRPDRWPEALNQGEACPWIVLKMAQPIAQGPLWDHLIKHCAERLIVVATANDLRQTEVQISRGLSWERTAQDVAWELMHNPRVNSLARCAHAIISFDAEGATLLSRNPDVASGAPAVATKCHLFFDPQAIEGTWRQQHPGGMIGYTTCLTAAIVYQWMLAGDSPDIHAGVQSGLAAMRVLHKQGYQELETDDGKPSVGFPFERIAAKLAQGDRTMAEVEVQDPVRNLAEAVAAGDPSPRPEFWTILHDRHRHDLDRIAEQIVLEGIERALPDVPFGRFGHLVTVDRQEIESFRTICTLVDEYLKQERPKRPLSIGVFGAPGSGKSFGMIQVAKSLAPGKIEKLEFNLSQMNTSAELPDALHQVRDANLQGKIPLVFWDEFDASLGDKPLGWLRYFLAPMQDGAFREGQIIHPIGRSIFVFAGGTSHTMAGFGQGLSDDQARAAKVPDFVSRLKGYVNVLGPDPQFGAHDPYFIIRRAILLRSLLLRSNPALFQDRDGVRNLIIDTGVLRAFLHVSRYKHGIRSIETIITMSQLSNKSKFARSSLPPEGQLNLHVDGQEFLALVQQARLDGVLLEKLARAHHDFFRRTMEDKGYQPSPTTDEAQKTHSALVPWEQLPEDEKEQNRSAVRDIPNKLNRVGYVMIPARSNEPTEFPRGEEDLERLSRMEHERWMKAKLEAGWAYAPQTDKKRRLHKALLPWDDERLSEEERDKDREFVRAIPGLLAEIGYTVVDLNDEQQAS
jgi:hypothetical protein